MRKSIAVTLSVLVAAVAFAPAAQAKRHKRAAAASAPMMMAPMGNPRMDAQGQFYATPVGGPDIMAGLGGPLAAPLAIPGAAVGTGLDVLSAPLK